MSDHSQAVAQPIHITAALAKLAQLRDTFHLPHPQGVRFTKCNGIATVELTTFGELMAWADRLEVPQDARHSSSYTDGSSSHSCWTRWNGWDVRLVAWVDAPMAMPAESLPVTNPTVLKVGGLT